MLIKVCGMRDRDNIKELEKLDISLVGFIFYPKSTRYFDGELADIRNVKHPSVGVFVNEDLDKVYSIAQKSGLVFIQLHGNEDIAYCKTLTQLGYKVIKAISIESVEDLSKALQYDGVVDMLLFDTKCSTYGGSGERFNWKILNTYNGRTHFLLSGGLDITQIEEINNFNHPQFAGIDINSRFELEAGIKDISKIKTFIEQLKR